MFNLLNKCSWCRVAWIEFSWILADKILNEMSAMFNLLNLSDLLLWCRLLSSRLLYRVCFSCRQGFDDVGVATTRTRIYKQWWRWFLEWAVLPRTPVNWNIATLDTFRKEEKKIIKYKQEGAAVMKWELLHIQM